VYARNRGEVGWGEEMGYRGYRWVATAYIMQVVNTDVLH
jgi:hypothetical protein